MCQRAALDGATHPRCKTGTGLDGLTSFFHYDSVIRQAIKSIKYRLVSDLAVELVACTPQKRFRSMTMLVPIPLHPRKLRERGFNQAELMGDLVAKNLQIPMKVDMLRRTRFTQAQAMRVNRAERFLNMKHAFEIIRGKDVSGAKIVLFDDVYTTGATLTSAAAPLKKAGASSVWALTIAR